MHNICIEDTFYIEVTLINVSYYKETIQQFLLGSLRKNDANQVICVSLVNNRWEDNIKTDCKEIIINKRN